MASMDVSLLVAFLQSIVIPWLIQIERRLSKIEGYIEKACNGGKRS